MLVLKAFATTVMSSIVLPAMALSFDDMTPAEIKALPKWCTYTLTFRGEADAELQYQALVQRYGEGWTHVHHYCWALGAMIRHNQPGIAAQEQTGLVREAIANIDYVLRHAPREFFLRREVSSRKARLLQISGSLPAALEQAKAVAQEWPDRADSHGLVAEILLTMNRRQDARKVLDAAKSVVKDGDRLQKIRLVLKL